MRTSVRRTRGIPGFFLLDSVLGMMIIVVFLAGLFQAFATLSLIVQKQEQRLEKELKDAEIESLEPFL